MTEKCIPLGSCLQCVATNRDNCMHASLKTFLMVQNERDWIACKKKRNKNWNRDS